jgi:hypothetical protein
MVPAHGVRHEQMSREEIERFGISPPPRLPLSPAQVPYPGPVPVLVRFRDSAGLMWSRDGSGALRPVRFELVPPETARDRLRWRLRWPR